MIKQFAVIGLGRFGSSVAKTLTSMNHEVLAIDNNEDNVRAALAARFATQAMELDSTNIHALADLGLGHFDGVILAIGANLEDSILTALNLIELNVRNLVAKASSTEHGKILERLNVPRVVYPERDMGERVAKSLVQSTILEAIEVDPNCSVLEIKPPTHLVGKTLAEANLRSKYGIHVMAIKHGNEATAIAPDPAKRIYAEDVLVILGDTYKIRKLLDEG